jgi:hypothetical protein
MQFATVPMGDIVVYFCHDSAVAHGAFFPVAEPSETLTDGRVAASVSSTASTGTSVAMIKPDHGLGVV